MSLLKNTYGVSISFIPKVPRASLLNKFGGSSLERKQKQEQKDKKISALVESAIANNLSDEADGEKILVKEKADPVKSLLRSL